MLNAINSLLFDPNYSTFWTAVGAAAQAFAAIMATAALLYSITTFGRSLRISHYTEVDRMYFEILRLTIGKPHFLAPDMIKSTEQQLEYDTFAFMLWNFLETIYDRCQGDKKLWDTWQPILVEDAKVHRAWFLRPENNGKFKRKFYNYVCRRVLAAPRSQLTSAIPQVAVKAG